MRSLLLAACAFAIGLGTATMASAEMTKSEVEKIIEEYLMNNGDVILQSVNDYQTKGIAERQKQALQANDRKIFKSEYSPAFGNPEGDITVVEFFDYNCGYCKRVVEDVNKLIENDPKVRVVFKELPILGPTSETAARWALAAKEQGKYLEFHNALMTSKGRINDSKLESVAKDLGLDIDKMKTDANSETVSKQIENNRTLSRDLQITGTPGFIIGNEIIPGAIGYDDMVASIKSQREAMAKN